MLKNGVNLILNGDIMNPEEWEKKVSNIGWDNTRGPIVHDILKDWKVDRMRLLDEIEFLKSENNHLFNNVMMNDHAD